MKNSFHYLMKRTLENDELQQYKIKFLAHSYVHALINGLLDKHSSNYTKKCKRLALLN